MILVLLGTQDKSFKRLLDAIQKCIDDKTIKEKVVVQSGHTKYDSSLMEIFSLLPKGSYDDLIKKARILITHGGVSSIFDGIKNNIPVIAAARLREYGEHTNNHQLEIINKFADEGYLLALNDFDELGEKIKEAKTFKAKKFESTTNNVVNLIKDYIDNN